MDEEFIPYKEAAEIKRLGFCGECLRWYTKNKTLTNSEGSEGCNRLPAPLYQQAFAWFREEHSLHVIIRHGFGTPVWYDYIIENQKKFEWFNDSESESWETHKEAELACLQKLIRTITK